jgi:hypothetical protein
VEEVADGPNWLFVEQGEKKYSQMKPRLESILNPPPNAPPAPKPGTAKPGTPKPTIFGGGGQEARSQALRSQGRVVEQVGHVLQSPPYPRVCGDLDRPPGRGLRS